MKCVVLGNGEIGQAIKAHFSKYHTIVTYDTKDNDCERDLKYKECELLLVCLPYTKNFVDIVNRYIKTFLVEATIIFSTVPVGTTRQIENAIHAPIEGKHPKLESSVANWKFSLGAEVLRTKAIRFFMEAKKEFDIFSPEQTELFKLASTSFYGVMLEYMRYIKKCSETLGVDYKDFLKYNENYNNLYKSLGMEQFTRPILTAPDGEIGGHCVVPNAKLLNDQFGNVFLEEIIKGK